MALTETAGGLWFREDLYPDIACGFHVSAVLHQERSKFQDILILDTPALGKVLVLDGIVQCAQKDEAIYHEMLAHAGMFLRQALSPATASLEVLVVGGGDGGVARECLKHAGVVRVIVVDIDPRVRETTLAHFPELPAGAYADPRLTAVDSDAAELVRKHRDRFDLIVADTPDPVGTALPLFGREFVADCHAALKMGGVFIRHGGSLLLQRDEFIQARDDVEGVFGAARTRAGLLATCTYLGGWFTWLSAVKDVAYPDDDAAWQALHALFERSALDVHWYSPQMHMASQVLPKWCAKNVKGAQE
jgi:spermidine synthase